MSDPGFIVALFCAKKVMGVTAVLSRSLQRVNQDLFEAMESVSYAEDKLVKWRTDSNDVDAPVEWENIFSAASEIAAASGNVLALPRVVGRQLTQNNVQPSNPSEYYRRTIWFPYTLTQKSRPFMTNFQHIT
jgi:hypothetical protein